MNPPGETPVFVRTASKQDVETLRNLLRETWHATYDSLVGEDKVAELDADWHSVEALQRQLDVPGAEFVVADTGEEILGLAYAAQEGRRVKLHQLYVAPRAQGMGIGLSLLQEIFFCFDDADTIWLEVHPENLRAIAFYARQGFVEKGEVSSDRHSDVPATLMELNLQELAD